MSAMFESSEAAILDRVFQPDAGDWPKGAAEAILCINFGKTDLDRMMSLLEKAKAGRLSSLEPELLENYRHVGTLRELIKSAAAVPRCLPQLGQHPPPRPPSR